jgi:hypothetical protein
MLAQSQASVPPAPAWMSRKQLQGVGRVVEHAAEFQALDVLRQLGGLGLDGLQAGFVAFVLAHFEELGVVGQLARQAVDASAPRRPAIFFLAEFLGLLGVVPDRGLPARR